MVVFLGKTGEIKGKVTDEKGPLQEDCRGKRLSFGSSLMRKETQQ
jgi:hypothetical protein